MPNPPTWMAELKPGLAVAAVFADAEGDLYTVTGIVKRENGSLYVGVNELRQPGGFPGPALRGWTPAMVGNDA